MLTIGTAMAGAQVGFSFMCPASESGFGVYGGGGGGGLGLPKAAPSSNMVVSFFKVAYAEFTEYTGGFESHAVLGPETQILPRNWL